MGKGLQSRSRRWLAWVAVALLAGVLLPVPAITSAATNNLAGEWSTSIFGESVPTQVGNAANLIGRWKFTFTENMTYTLAREDVGVVTTGKYSIDGDRVTFTDTGGIQSCANPQPGTVNSEDVATGVYTWKLDDGQLELKRVHDQCALRTLLFTSEDLIPYVACTTAAYPLGNTVALVQQTPVPASPAATPVAATSTPENLLTGPGEETGKSGDATKAVDNVLAQLSACWATGDPGRVLPLFSETFLDDLVALGPQGTTIEDVGRVFKELMETPATWKRVTKVTMDGSDKASAVVAMTVDDKPTYFKMSFVLEKGQWKLADLGTETTKPKS